MPKWVRYVVFAGVAAVAVANREAFTKKKECKDPMVNETTSVALEKIARIVGQNLAGAEVTDMAGPFMNNALRNYLCNDPMEVLVEAKSRIDASLDDSAEQDRPVISSEADLVATLIANVHKLENPTSESERRQIKEKLAQAIEEIEQRVATRNVKLDDARNKVNELEEAVEERGGGREPRQPSFPCQNATTRTEHMICGDAQLGDIDGRLGDAYRALRGFVAPSDSTRIRDEERRWITRRDERIASECTHDSTVDRTCVMGLWKERIAQLEAQLRAARNRRL